MSISPSEKIKVTIEGNIATVVIDNPAANTWDCLLYTSPSPRDS